MSRARLVMGIDAGNTKTVAALADTRGRVLGYGRSGPANIYVGFDRAVRTLREAYQRALDMAGADEVEHLSLSATGADWPEDFADLRRALKASSMARGDGHLSLVNDAVAAVWSGSPTGEGVAVAVGTSAGTGARKGDRVWHSSYWQEAEGAVQLGEKALRALYRAELGVGPETSLSRAVLEHFGMPSAADLLHAFTSRTPTLGAADAGRVAHVLLEEAEEGDGVARRLVEDHACALADYALVAAREVGLSGEAFPLILTGGVMRHSGTSFRETLVRRVQAKEPSAHTQPPDFEPVGGALCIALDALGCHHAQARVALRDTLPAPDFFSTSAKE